MFRAVPFFAPHRGGGSCGPLPRHIGYIKMEYPIKRTPFCQNRGNRLKVEKNTVKLGMI